MLASIPSSALRAPLTTRPARSQVVSVKVGSPLPRSERSVVEKSSSASASIASSSSSFAPSRRRSVRAFSTAEEQAETSAGSLQRAKRETIEKRPPAEATNKHTQRERGNSPRRATHLSEHRTNRTNQTKTKNSHLPRPLHPRRRRPRGLGGDFGPRRLDPRDQRRGEVRARCCRFRQPREFFFPLHHQRTPDSLLSLTPPFASLPFNLERK